MKLIRADKALAYSKGRRAVVADLNSRVDYGHPALAGRLTGGYDFVSERAARAASLDQSSAGFLDRSSAAILDQSSAAFLDQSSAAFLDQSTASFLDQTSASFLDATNPAHGHATFCAGLIAAVAPEAMIMPLRVFDDNGAASTSSRRIRAAITLSLQALPSARRWWRAKRRCRGRSVSEALMEPSPKAQSTSIRRIRITRASSVPAVSIWCWRSRV